MLTSIIRLLGADTAKANCLQGAIQCDTGLPKVVADGAAILTILQVLFGVLAVVAVVVITIAGLKMIVESTNPQETSRARNTIVFAVIGLIIAISGQIIVTFVLDFVK